MPLACSLTGRRRNVSARPEHGILAMQTRRNWSDESRETAYLGGIVILFAVIIVLMFLNSCTYPFATRALVSEAPFVVDFAEGTHWTYLRIDRGVDQSSGSVPLDTLDIRVEEVLSPPRNPVLLEPLFNRAELTPPVPAGLGLYLPLEVPPDSADMLEPLTTTLTGPVFRIAARGRTSEGKYPHFVANSTAGLLDITSWIWRWPAEPVPVYRRYERSASLLVPAPDSPIGGWCTDGSGWFVTCRDTLVTVPAGDFLCTEISYHFGTRPGGEPDLTRYREYWSPGVGLVAWHDLRVEGDGRWVLAAWWRESRE